MLPALALPRLWDLTQFWSQSVLVQKKTEVLLPEMFGWCSQSELNWKLLNTSNFLFPQKEYIGKLILILFIHKVSETSWACRGWQCLNTYRFRILSWCCCVDQFVLFSCILLLFLISVLHWKPLQTQTSLCFWHCAHGRVVFPYEVLMTKTITPKGHCGNLFRIPVVTNLWRLWTDLVWIAKNFRGKKINLVVI